MKITVGNEEQELNFGVGFVRELDTVAGMKKDGMTLGYGTIRSLPALQAYDSAVLSDVLYSAAVDNSPRSGKKDFDKYIESLTMSKLEKLFADVQKEIKASVPVQVSLKNIQPQ